MKIKVITTYMIQNDVSNNVLIQDYTKLTRYMHTFTNMYYRNN